VSTDLPDLVVNYLCHLGRAADDTNGGTSPEHSAMPDTIRMLKQRSTDTRRVHYVSFDSDSGEHWRYMVATEKQTTGEERVCGSAGGSGNGPRRDLPWANLGYSWGNGALYAAGDVIGAGAENAATVSLVFADRVVHDDNDNGVVAFVVTTDELPTAQRILDAAGTILAEHPAP
jgi:hypothetical protein